jgi:hypothetical protein
LQNAAISDRKTVLINALRVDGGKKYRAGTINLTFLRRGSVEGGAVRSDHGFSLPQLSELRKTLSSNIRRATDFIETRHTLGPKPNRHDYAGDLKKRALPDGSANR